MFFQSQEIRVISMPFSAFYEWTKIICQCQDQTEGMKLLKNAWKGYTSSLKCINSDFRYKINTYLLFHKTEQ